MDFAQRLTKLMEINNVTTVYAALLAVLTEIFFMLYLSFFMMCVAFFTLYATQNATRIWNKSSCFDIDKT